MGDLVSRQGVKEWLERWNGYLDQDMITRMKLKVDDIPYVQPQWIPCSERLPKYGQVVLWCNEYGSVFTSAITGHIGYSWHIGKRHWGADVVAWMPLPEPYKGDATDSQDESTPVYLSNLYLCDPDKNTECKKTACYRNGGECIHTVHKEYRRVE